MTELKPCPFCGGEAKIGIGMGEYWVMCTNCEASSGMSTVDGAIELWNRRAEDKPKVPFGITINGDIGYECPHCKAVYGAGCLPEDKICEFCHKDMRVKE